MSCIKKAVVSNLLQEFYEDLCGRHFAGRVTVEKIVAAKYHCRRCLKIVFIIANVMRCAKRLQMNLR